ncbi:porin family protein [Spiribacter pallidus]|jgi:opacity protein-like surface antigen|uniref:porin family protein n=1 Tax=Spiribacter pallidus TaxID=1987936 RepID=UPI0034A06117
MLENGKLQALVLATALGVSAVSEAQLIEDAYIGGGLMPWQYEGAGESEGALGGRLMAGVMLNDHLGFEAHFGWMGEEDSGNDRTVELDSVDSALVRLNRPVNPRADLYALLGFASVRMVLRPLTIAGTDEAPSASGVAFGAGAAYRIADDWSVSVDLMRYLSEPDFDFEAVTGSVRWHF